MLAANKITKEIPAKYLCSITQQIMLEPVITADGHTYEREAIEFWLNAHNTSPKTNLALSNKNLIPNLDKRSDIEEYLEQNPKLRKEVYFPKYLTINLSLAIREKNIMEVRSLLAKDNRLLSKLFQGLTFWHLACMEGSILIVDEILSKLQDKHINLILETHPANFKPIYANLLLEERLLHQDFKKADLLFILGAELEQLDIDGNTLLHRLVIQGKIEPIIWLLDKFYDLDLTNIECDTPLLLAINYSQLNIAKFLIDKGANIQAKNNKGFNAITLAALKNNVDILKLFDANLINFSPLQLAVKLNNLDLLKACIEEGYDLEEKDIKGHTPLYLVITTGNLAAADLLLKNGAKVEPELLHNTVLTNNIDMVNILLKFIDINAPDKEGNTALHLAAEHGYKEIILSLLKAGASHKYLNHKGKTPIKVALKAGRQDIAQLIIETVNILKKNRVANLERENKDKAAQITGLTHQLKKAKRKIKQELLSKIDQLIATIKPEDLLEVLTLALEDENKARKIVEANLPLSYLFAGCDTSYQAQKALKKFYPAYNSYLNKKIALNEQIILCSVGTLEGHVDYVNSLQVLPNNKLVSSSNDGSIKIWNMLTMQCEATLKGHTSSVYSLQLLPDNKIVSASNDGSIKIWDISSKQCVITLQEHTNRVSSLKLLPHDKLASGSDDCSIKIWDIATGHCEAALKGHTSSVLSLQLLTHNKLASGSDDCSIKIWDIATGECEATLEGHAYGVLGLQLLPNNKLASASLDNSIKIWNISTGQCAATLNEHTYGVSSLQMLSNNKLASGSWDNSIKIWDISALYEEQQVLNNLEKKTEACKIM